jgi:hypothetical protein
MGGRRRSKKSKSRKNRKTRRGGAAPPSFEGAIRGADGQPAGAAFTAVSTAGLHPVAGSSYSGAPSTAAGYSGGRRSRKHRHRRHRSRRMRGGSDGSRVFTEFRGESIGANAPSAAVRGPVYTGSQPS